MIGGLTGLAVLGFGFWSSWQIARAKTQEDYEKKKQRRGRYDAAPKFEWDAFLGHLRTGRSHQPGRSDARLVAVATSMDHCSRCSGLVACAVSAKDIQGYVGQVHHPRDW